MKTRILLRNLLGGMLLTGMMQGTSFSQMGTPDDDGCTHVDEVIVCEDSDGDGDLECDNGGEVRVGSDGERRLYPGGKLLKPVVPTNPTPNPTPNPGSIPTSGSNARGDQADDSIGIYVVEGLNLHGGLTFVVVLNDQANPNDSPGPYDGETGGVDGYTEIEWTYLTLLEMGLTEREAMSILSGEEETDDDEPSATKIKKPVFGPHIMSF